ncbi:MAG: glycosyltransferase, partial [Chthoniobacteraceae bacterium]
MNPSITILIPCLNAEHGIADVVRDFKSEFPSARILVVDNNSTDATAECAKNAGAEVIEERNRG